MAKIEYRKEFFDREYSGLEAYRRVWKYARKYWFRLLVGIVSGMLTAGTLVPFFQIVQPALQRVESHDNEVSTAEMEASGAIAQEAAPSAAGVATGAATEAPAASTHHEKKRKNAFEKEIERNSKLPGWYPTVEKWAAKCGIKLLDEKGGMGGALVLIVCFIVPAVAFLRLGLMYLNNYCLCWSGSHAVADLRVELLEHVQKQNLQFFGRVDMGQLLMRIVSDPATIQIIMTTILTEVALAPFEIIVAFAYIIWFAIANQMLPTLILIFIGFPLFVLPIQMIGRRVKKWAKNSMQRGSMVGSKIHEVLTCIRVVKSYNTEQYENVRYAYTNKYLLKSTMRGLRVGLMVRPTVETVGILLICAFIVWCFAMGIKMSNVVPMLAPLLIIYKPVKQLSKLQVQLETSHAALNRIYSVLDLHMELPEKADPVRKPTFDDRISFENVTFKYDTAESPAVSAHRTKPR